MNAYRTLGLALLAALAVPLAQAADFNTGSTGTEDIVIDADRTIDLPPNGIVHVKSLRVQSGGTLRFKRNELNTPVIILAKEDIIVEGQINVSAGNAPNTATGGAPIGGLGGPGGFDGGKPGFAGDAPPGDGYGPGGGKGGNNDFSPDGAGAGSFANVANWGESRNNHGQIIYGNALLIPLIGGSGGGGSRGSPGFGGGGGGGAILLASNTRVHITGSVFARGGGRTSTPVNAGSGGAIRLLAPVVSGTGEINVRGGAGDNSAAEGRMRVDTIDRSDLRLNFNPRENHTVGANMFVFPARIPKLDIVEVAGNSVPIGSGPVKLQLPFGSNPNQTIKVRAQDFGAKVPIAVVLTPDSGSRILVEKLGDANLEIDNAAANPVVLTIPVALPQNELVTLNVWTR